ncbi:hypothetical protein PC9H_006809 [Pleurotus ostreatus]|uniref:Uncharacterized protein n=1 Tax=Pleurotus ostreatus TaxID=5322 RepID=A0A8H6ZWX4_PLEOS|nr:uncharacterized protein PC9H_002808 [Pleurotus ostreatus]XP_036632368.1 uncharacterized protein PC9H_006809 [Pleurotus ostreatus]KAF7416021.1 hypothetical protein PC9H_002808 [Pleurotus ostreatus]KAF7431090.1 hypothetical protein PC9H_006809 [Pleurotus ostreatus]
MTDSTKPQIALVGSYSDAFVTALQDDFEVEQCDSVPNPATRTSSLAALALKDDDYTLSESDITLMLPDKTVLIFFGPTSTLLETIQSATNTPIDIPSLGLVDGLPLLVYMVDGMVNVASNSIPSEAQVLPLMQSALKKDSKMANQGFQLQVSPVDLVEQAAMSIDSAVSATRSTRAYVSNLEPPAGVIGFKRQKYNLNWYTDVYSYATGADCRGKTSGQFTSAGGIVAVDRGAMTGHHPGSSLQMTTYQPRGPESQIDGQVQYNISFEQDMQMFNNNGNSAYTFKAQYTNSFTLDQFQLHEVPGDSGVDFSVDYNGYYDRWADPTFVTDKWWNPGVYQKVKRQGRSYWIVRENLPADNLPINGLTVLSSSVGKYPLGCRAFKSNYWRTTSDDNHVSDADHMLLSVNV